MASEKIREVEVAIEAALLQQRDELLAAVKGLLGLVQLVDSRDDMPIEVANNHRYVDALALVERIERRCAPDQTVCPNCREWVDDFDGFGVLAHEACGYCSHPSRDDGVCGICKHSVGR